MLKEKHIDRNLPEVFSLLSSQKKSRRFESSKEKSSNIDSKSKTIKFVGNLEDNIEELVSSLPGNSLCKTEFSQILSIYAKKINKLREERNYYKKLASEKEEESSKIISKLKKKVKGLQARIEQATISQCTCSKCTCFQYHHEGLQFTEQFSDINQYGFNQPEGESIVNASSPMQSMLNICNPKQPKEEEEEIQKKKVTEAKEESILIDSESKMEPSSFSHHLSQNQSFQSQLSQAGEHISQQDLQKLMFKYNFTVQQLQQVLTEYEVQHKLAQQLFDSQPQRNLYQLGHRMQRSLQNKKVTHDIKRLSEIKSQVINSNEKTGK